MTKGTTSTNGDASQGEPFEIGFDGGGPDSIASELAMTLADAMDEDVTEIEPLGEYLDCEALDRLVRSAETSLSISFVYEGRQVFVSGDGSVEITRLAHE